MEPITKFQDLEVDKKYKVLERKEINTKHGKTYILKVVDENEIEFQIFSTPFLTTYIDKESPTGPFEFTVKIFKDKKCPVIDDLPITKFQDLEVGKQYKVLSKKQIYTKHGRTYILKVVDEYERIYNERVIEFKIFSTPFLTTYIDQKLPTSPFEFTVKKFNNKKCPVITGQAEYDGFLPF